MNVVELPHNSESAGAVDRLTEADFAALYSGLRRYAAVVGDLDMDPDDLVQDALVRTLRRGDLATFDNPASYLRRCIVNRVLELRRSAGRRGDARMQIETVADDPASTSMVGVDDLLPEDPTDRAIVWLMAFEDRRSDEIAAILDMSSSAVRKRTQRIRQRAQRDARGTEEEGS